MGEGIATSLKHSFEYNIFLGLLVLFVISALSFLVWLYRKQVMRSEKLENDLKSLYNEVASNKDTYYKDILAAQMSAIDASNNSTEALKELKAFYEAMSRKMDRVYEEVVVKGTLKQ